MGVRPIGRCARPTHDRPRRLRAAAAQGRAARAHRGDARAGAGVRAGGAQQGRAALRRRGGAASRLPLQGPPVVPGHLLRQLRRAPRPSRTSTTSRTPTCPRRPGRACATPRSSSTRRRTPSAASPSRPAAWGSAARSIDGAAELGISSGLILCFLRDRSEEAALRHAGGSPALRRAPAGRRPRLRRGGQPSRRISRRLPAGPGDGPPGRRARRRGGSAGVHLGGAGRARGAAHRPRRAVPGGRSARGAAGGGAGPADRVPVLEREAARRSRRCANTTCRRWCGVASS